MASVIILPNEELDFDLEDALVNLILLLWRKLANTDDLIPKLVFSGITPNLSSVYFKASLATATPTTLPFLSKTGPPLLPGWRAALICICEKLSSIDSRLKEFEKKDESWKKS